MGGYPDERYPEAGDHRALQRGVLPVAASIAGAQTLRSSLRSHGDRGTERADRDRGRWNADIRRERDGSARERVSRKMTDQGSGFRNSTPVPWHLAPDTFIPCRPTGNSSTAKRTRTWSASCTARCGMRTGPTTWYRRRSCERWTTDPDNPRAFLFTIAANLARDEARTAVRQQAPPRADHRRGSSQQRRRTRTTRWTGKSGNTAGHAGPQPLSDTDRDVLLLWDAGLNYRKSPADGLARRDRDHAEPGPQPTGRGL